jgi:hypothetical protein
MLCGFGFGCAAGAGAAASGALCGASAAAATGFVFAVLASVVSVASEAIGFVMTNMLSTFSPVKPAGVS